MSRFSAKLMDHFQAPRNVGQLEHPDRVGLAGTPHHGPFTRLELQIAGGTITSIRFQTHGCGSAIACASALTELALGKTIDEARTLTPECIIAALDGLPDDKRHCADTAIAALRDALK